MGDTPTEPSCATRCLLELSCWRGVGTAKLRAVGRQLAIKATNDPEQLLLRSFPKVQRPDHSERRKVSEQADSIISECRKLGIHLFSVADPGFPAHLAALPDSPAFLYVRGDAGALRQPCVAVVGTREASERGRKAAFAIARFLAGAGVCVVSGLALGIDAEAHKGALSRGGRTVAVLAHGVDTISPATNRFIGEELLAKGGALVGEHPPGTAAHRAEFVRRNRIQSGLSTFSIIVETGATGGAVHQARFAHQQGRPIFVFLPRDADEQFRTEGARYLMGELGARIITGTAELNAALEAALVDRAPSKAANTEQLELSW